jgi:predicted Holliday junction resolvase-like endonuclease
VTILEWTLLSSVSLCTLVFIINKYKQRIEDSLRERMRDEINIQADSVINYNMRQLEKIVSEVPEKVLRSITSSSNVKKGALGELIGYVEIKATYDRIIPLGNIVDFIGIKFDTKDEQGYIDFIDVKTGKSARLSKDQKALQQLVSEKRINFIKVKVESETRS